MKQARWALALTILACSLRAQEALPKFEVASIKENHSGTPGVRISGARGGPRFAATNIALRSLIRIAYDVQDFQLSDVPGWVSADRFDLDARAEAGSDPKEEQSHAMLRTLLVERFGLKVRRETKNGPIYAIVVAKDGPKLKRSDDQSPMPTGALANPQPAAGAGPARGAIEMESGGGTSSLRMVAGGIDKLTLPLMTELRRPVVNRTNLTGFYDMTLRWTPDSADAGRVSAESNLPAIFTAIQEQLGLRLESTMGPIEILVIEKVERPAEN